MLPQRLPNYALNKKKTSSTSLISVKAIATHGLFGLVCLYIGVLLGMSGKDSTTTKQCPVCPPCSNSVTQTFDARHSPRKEAQATKNVTFPSTVSNVFSDFATVPREDFNNYLEIGIPLDDSRPGSEEAIIFYTSDKSKPKGGGSLQSISAKKAVENCGTVKVVLTQPWSKGASTQCFAVLPQWESYNIYKFMRVGPSGGFNMKNNLRYTSRSMNDKGIAIGVPDYKLHTVPSYGALVEYLQNLDNLLDDLRPIIEQLLRESSNPTSKTIIVQVCNYGQVELFHNYVCSAKARGLDYSHILMFATDEKTYDLCKALGIPVYYNEAIFGSMPEGAARGYGDRIFSKMMMAKVYCVHSVLSLGYNVLFQDVDVVWYKNPLPYLESKELAKWDLMFQDDGARSHRYAPYSPNTGFYFVRYSPETLYFFGMLLRSGDNIAKTSSHQAALTVLLNHHATWRGLLVKVWKKGENNPFPGGVEFHQKKDLMKKLLKNETEVQPYLFHMSWTKNKDNKKLFFQQMGEWFLKEDCLTGWDCCLAEPEVTCHYRDKPSIIPCSHMKPIDAGKPSFW